MLPRTGDVCNVAARHSRGTPVVGVCMECDHMQPALAIHRELSVCFVFGCSPEEFAATLGHLAAAFEERKKPGRHAKILFEP